MPRVGSTAGAGALQRKRDFFRQRGRDLRQALSDLFEQRQPALSAKPLDRPERVPAAKSVLRECVRLGEADQRCAAEAGTPPHRVDRAVSVAAGGGEPEPVLLAEALNLAEAETYRKAAVSRGFEHVVPIAPLDADWADVDAVLPGVAHDLRRRVEPIGWAFSNAHAKTSGDACALFGRPF